ncbi:MAG: hypothetical protein JWQ35_1838 [Bacteriovoracaceae bacterium]|nr:hypothetical protein [Bacteriovoracaceae bacterium]
MGLNKGLNIAVFSFVCLSVAFNCEAARPFENPSICKKILRVLITPQAASLTAIALLLSIDPALRYQMRKKADAERTHEKAQKEIWAHAKTPRQIFLRIFKDQDAPYNVEVPDEVFRRNTFVEWAEFFNREAHAYLEQNQLPDGKIRVAIRFNEQRTSVQVVRSINTLARISASLATQNRWEDISILDKMHFLSVTSVLSEVQNHWAVYWLTHPVESEKLDERAKGPLKIALHPPLPLKGLGDASMTESFSKLSMAIIGDDLAKLTEPK